MRERERERERERRMEGRRGPEEKELLRGIRTGEG